MLRGTGAGTSAWGQVVATTDISGILPAGSGGTGQNSLTSLPLTTPVISNPAITGGGTWTGSPSLTTPTIASFTNATHNHTNAAGGGTLGSSAITGIDKSITTTDSNPYKFRAYRAAAQDAGSGVFAVINHDTESFDTNSNFDIVTNKGRYTAPVNGFYFFTAHAAIASSSLDFLIAFYKNGVLATYGSRVKLSASLAGGVVSDFMQLTAGDYIEVEAFASGTIALEVANGSVENYFAGFLVSRT